MNVMAYPISSVYGPVESWRFGRSLGVDPIGQTSTCSFNCVYCQLGAIERHTDKRRLFVPTEQIRNDLQLFAPWDVDVITLSGSGEPTLALNLGEILQSIKAITGKPVVVLTNGSLLNDPQVREELAIADIVSVKVDAVTSDDFWRINRPYDGITLSRLWDGIKEFRQMYPGQFTIQTMLLLPWAPAAQAEYIELMRSLAPHEIQLNTPTRPKPMAHHIEARGNQDTPTYPTRSLKTVSAEVLRKFGDRIQQTLHIPVRNLYDQPVAQ